MEKILMKWLKLIQRNYLIVHSYIKVHVSIEENATPVVQQQFNLYSDTLVTCWKSNKRDFIFEDSFNFLYRIIKKRYFAGMATSQVLKGNLFEHLSRLTESA